ncbi:MAG: DUF4403 family protein [Desulfobacteraceae bacterium]|nr:DUF4403 family protein [Desulfobacteraceae bacterium]
MKRITIIFICVILLASTGLIATRTLIKANLNPAHPKIAADNTILPQPENSTVFVPVQLSMQELQNAVNRSVPETFSGAKNDPISGAVKNDELKWSARRGVMNLSGNGQRLELAVSATGRADIKGKVKAAFIKIPFQAHADLGATLRAAANPKIRNNWTVEPNLSANINVTKAEIPIGGAVGKALGRPKISVKSHVQKGLEKEMVKLVNKYNRELSQDTRLREAAEKEWRKLFLTERLSDTPSAWITVTPVRIVGQNFSADGNYLSGGIGIVAETKIVMNEKKPENAVKPLPDLQIVSKVPNNFSFCLLGTVSWKELNKTLDSRVQGKTFKDKDGSGLTVRDIDISANGSNIMVEADISARASGWFSSPAEGTIYLSGHPVHDPKKNIFYVTKLNYELDTENMLTKAADWLLKPLFLQKLQEELVVDLKEHRKKVITQAEQQINKLKAELPEGISVSTVINDLQLKHFSLSKDFLYLIVNANGRLNVSVTKLILN